MSLESAAEQRDLMHVGPYLVTFDEAGADIEHGSLRATLQEICKPSASSRTPKEGRHEQPATADHDGGRI